MEDCLSKGILNDWTNKPFVFEKAKLQEDVIWSADSLGHFLQSLIWPKVVFDTWALVHKEKEVFIKKLQFWNWVGRWCSPLHFSWCIALLKKMMVERSETHSPPFPEFHEKCQFSFSFRNVFAQLPANMVKFNASSLVDTPEHGTANH